MESYRGNSLVFVREFTRKSAPENEAKLLALLSPSESALYQSATANKWVDPAVASGVLLKAARLLFPRDPDPCFRLGFTQAGNQFRGLYKALLAVATVPFVVKQSALFWKNYHSRGDAHTKWEFGEKKGVFWVDGYPELPEVVRQNISGFIAGTLGLTGASDVRVDGDFADPNSWKWVVTWK